MRSGGVLFCCGRVQGNRKEGNGSFVISSWRGYKIMKLAYRENTIVSQAWKSARIALSICQGDPHSWIIKPRVGHRKIKTTEAQET